jgi:hypothetical protein
MVKNYNKHPIRQRETYTAHNNNFDRHLLSMRIFRKAGIRKFRLYR